MFTGNACVFEFTKNDCVFTGSVCLYVFTGNACICLQITFVHIYKYRLYVFTDKDSSGLFFILAYLKRFCCLLEKASYSFFIYRKRYFIFTGSVYLFLLVMFVSVHR